MTTKLKKPHMGKICPSTHQYCINHILKSFQTVHLHHILIQCFPIHSFCCQQYLMTNSLNPSLIQSSVSSSMRKGRFSYHEIATHCHSHNPFNTPHNCQQVFVFVTERPRRNATRDGRCRRKCVLL